MLIEEVRSELGRDLPAFDPKRHADRYRAQPRDRRRIINALYRAGGTMDYSELSASCAVAPGALAELQKLGLLIALPSPESPRKVVLPLELLFATPLAEDDPEKLVEMLKVCPREALWSMAGACGIEVDGAGEHALRARLFRHALSGRSLEGLDAGALEPVRRLRERGWRSDTVKFLKTLGHRWPPSMTPVVELLTSPRFAEGGLQSLILRLAILPVREAPGSTAFRDVAVPVEMRKPLEALLRAPPPAAPEPARAARVPALADRECAAGQEFPYVSKEGRLRGTLLKYLLLVENDPPKITQRGTVNLRDLARLARTSGDAEEDLLSINDLAVRLGCLSIHDDRVGVRPEAEALLSRPAAGFPSALAQKFATLKVVPRGWWLEEDVFRKMAGKGSAALLDTLKGPGATACLHCVAKALASEKEFSRPVRYGQHSGLESAAGVVKGLAEALYEFGLAEAAFRSGRVFALRWTRSGAAAFGKLDSGPAPAAGTGALVVQPSGEVIADDGVPFEDLRRLARAAAVRSVDAVAIFALSRATVLKAAQRGENLGKLKDLLVARSRVPLPQPVAFLLDEIGARVGEVEVVPCSAVLKVRDPMILKSLRESLVPLGDHIAALPPSADPDALLERLRKAGYLPRAPERPSGVETAPATVTPFSAPAPEDDDDLPECRCAEESTDPDGILERLEHAEMEGLSVEVALRGGRRETLTVDAVDGDRVECWDEETEREVVLSLTSITSARLIE